MTLRRREPCERPTVDLADAGTLLQALIEAAERTVADLRKQAEDRRRALTEETVRLRDLEDRITLRGLLPGIQAHVEAARWGDKAGHHLARFQGIKKSLTETSKRASAEVLDRDFERRFAAESEALRAPRVSLDFPGREGEARRRKLLTPEHGLGEVLSEGEQKVVALADFLAEASLKRDRAPIVLDDPITSLDYKRLQHVVDRLVELSRERQMIAFTHNIWFTTELLSRFEHDRSSCSFYDVSREAGVLGVIHKGSHPRLDTFSDRRSRINGLIQEAGRASGAARDALVEKGYEELRGACEIVVETDLLQSVTQRYRPNVMMTGLDRICAERLPRAIGVIKPLFEKCCRLVASHSQPLETLSVRPTLEDLKTDWQNLQKARKEYLEEC